MNSMTQHIRNHIMFNPERKEYWTKYAADKSVSRVSSHLRSVFRETVLGLNVDGFWHDVLMGAVMEVDYDTIAQLLVKERE